MKYIAVYHISTNDVHSTVWVKARSMFKGPQGMSLAGNAAAYAAATSAATAVQ